MSMKQYNNNIIVCVNMREAVTDNNKLWRASKKTAYPSKK